MTLNAKIFNPRTLDDHTVAILDLDGTIADNKHRLHLLPKPLEDGSYKSTTKDWDKFHSELHKDGFVKHIYNMYCYMCSFYPTARRVVLTGRNVSNQLAVIRWLNKHNVDVDELYMRENDDHRPAPEFKMDVINQLRQQKLKIAFAFEDEEKICQTFKRNKIHTYKVTIPSSIITYELEK